MPALALAVPRAAAAGRCGSHSTPCQGPLYGFLATAKTAPSRRSSLLAPGRRHWSPNLGPSMLQLVVVGDGGVGCSSFVEQWVRKRFQPEQPSQGIAAEGTAAACSGTCRQIKVDGRPVLVLFWDVGCDERSESCSAVYSQADAVLVLYDVDRRATFASVEGWVSRVRSRCRSSVVPVAIIGTKMDLHPLRLGLGAQQRR